jgi:hypothetical protein
MISVTTFGTCSAIQVCVRSEDLGWVLNAISKKKHKTMLNNNTHGDCNSFGWCGKKRDELGR